MIDASARALAVAAALVLASGVDVSGQTASSGQTAALHGDAPAHAFLCDPAPVQPGSGEASAGEVQRLVDAATQAMILGDLEGATEFLDRALEGDPRAEEALYLRGRIAAQVGGAAAGVDWFCRYLAVAPRGASTAEVNRRLEQAMDESDANDLRRMLQQAASSFEAGEPRRSEELLTALLDRRLVPEALHDRGLVRLAIGQQNEGGADLRRFLELRPDTDRRPTVERVLQGLRGPERTPAPGSAFLLGAVLPGGGQYYTGRPGLGGIITGIVAGAVGTGYLYKRTTIRCRAPEPDGSCPPDAISSRETTRPFLVPALGIGAGIMLVSAAEAALRARGSLRSTEVPIGSDRSVRLELSLMPSGTMISVRLNRLLRHSGGSL